MKWGLPLLFVLVSAQLCLPSSIIRNPYSQTIGNKRKFQPYYYRSLIMKMIEILDWHCEGSFPTGLNLDSIKIMTLHPNSSALRTWNQIPLAKTVTNGRLCEDGFKALTRLGCGKGVALHPDCPRCHRDTSSTECTAASTGPHILNFTRHAHNIDDRLLRNTFPFVIFAKNTIISPCGGVATKCLTIQLRTACGASKNEEAMQTHNKYFNSSSSSSPSFRPGDSVTMKQLRDSLPVTSSSSFSYSFSTLHLPPLSDVHHDLGAVDMTLDEHHTAALSTNSPLPSHLPHYDKVLVLSYKYDSAIGHFLLEVLPTLSLFLPLLLSDPHVVLHYGCDKKFGKFTPTLKYFEFLGISRSRLVQGEVTGGLTLIPRGGACQDILYSPWEFLEMRSVMMRLAGVPQRLHWRCKDMISVSLGLNSRDGTAAAARNQSYVRQLQHKLLTKGFASATSPASQSILVNYLQDDTEQSANASVTVPFMIVLQRSRSKYSARKGDVSRIWSTAFFDQVVAEFRAAQPDRLVVAYSDRDAALMDCISCQVRLFSRASVVVGMHGAGLSNAAYMPAGGLLVEIAPTADGRMLPYAGPFSRLATAAGLHHLIFSLTVSMQNYSKTGTTFESSLLVKETSRAIKLINIP